MQRLSPRLGCTVDDLSAHLSIDCGDSATSIAEASFYQEQWRQVLGIEVTVNSMITKQGSQNRKTGNYVMSVTGCTGLQRPEHLP